MQILGNRLLVTVDTSTQKTYQSGLIIPYDTSYTKVSCDSSGNFLDLWMDGLYPERRYELKIKVVSGSTINYYDTNQPFKIIE